ncbi:hypothetical protein [Nitrosopumilus ureiphilus]|nr:hypothetical protein [Nitrosopumilus ureiphilus]
MVFDLFDKKIDRYIIKINYQNYGHGKIFDGNDNLLGNIMPGTEPNANHLLVQLSNSESVLHIKKSGHALDRELHIEDKNEETLGKIKGNRSEMFVVFFEIETIGKIIVKIDVKQNQCLIKNNKEPIAMVSMQ